MTIVLRSNFSSFPQYFRYISNVKSPITYKFVKCGCSNYFFLNSENLICRGTDVSKSYRESFGIFHVFCSSFSVPAPFFIILSFIAIILFADVLQTPFPMT